MTLAVALFLALASAASAQYAFAPYPYPFYPPIKSTVTQKQGPPEYDFAYDIADPHTGDVKSHQESRFGDAVRGRYAFIDPAGIRRVVEYTADDKNGFNAVVHEQPLTTSTEPSTETTGKDDEDSTSVSAEETEEPEKSTTPLPPTSVYPFPALYPHPYAAPYYPYYPYYRHAYPYSYQHAAFPYGYSVQTVRHY